MDSVNLDLYRYFKAAAESESFSEAARKLYISQPAVSQAIAQLEKNLDVRLFTRGHRKVKLTTAGETLYAGVVNGLRIIENAERRAASESRRSTITAAVEKGIFDSFLKPHLRQLVSSESGLSFRFISADSDSVIRLLQQRKADIGILLLYSNVRDPDLMIRQLTRLSTGFYVSPSYMARPQGEPMALTLSQVSKRSLVLPDNTTSAGRLTGKLFSQQGLNPSEAIQVSSIESAADYAESGVGISLLVSCFVEKQVADGALFRVKVREKTPDLQMVFAAGREIMNSESCIDAFDELKSYLVKS